MDRPADDAPSPPNEDAREAARRAALAGLANMRAMIAQGRTLPPRTDVENPDWDRHARRVEEMEAIVRTGTGPEDVARFEALEQDFEIEFGADMARLRAAVGERLVRSFDQIAARVEEKKFELPGEARDALDEVLHPYQDRLRE